MATERRNVRLTPPPRVEKAPRIVPESKWTPPPVAGQRGGPLVKGLTVLGLGGLTAVAVAVFMVLPDWAEKRRELESSGYLEAPPPGARPPLPQREGEGLPVGEAREVEASEGGRSRGEGTGVAELGSLSDKSDKSDKSDLSDNPPVPEPENSSDDPFAGAMTAGLAALDRGDFAAARAAFERARALEPGSRPAADGLARAAAGLARLRIEEHHLRAQALESEEAWREALAQYEEVLAIDATVRFAQEGRSRALERAELAETLEYHIANPGRLSSEAVLREASIAVNMAAEIEPAGPRHARQVAELSRIVRAYAKPIRARLRSDNQTEVVVYKVGRLGTFDERALELRPGTYTVVGSRQGYRDVRRQLVIEPGREPEPLVVRCEEEI